MAESRFSKLERTPGSKPGSPSAPDAAPTGALASAPPGAPSADGPDSYPSFLRLADEAFFVGNHREALRHYSRSLQLENNQVYPWIGQISCLLALKQFKEADLWSTRALEQFPEDTSLLSQRARVLAATGNLKRAMGASDYALAKGASAWTWLARGEVLLTGGEANALMCFEKAVEVADRDDWRVPLLAGVAFADRRQWSNAESFLRRAAERNSKNYFVWYELALVLMEMSFLDRARDAVSHAIQLKPDFRPARALEARIYKRPLVSRLLGVFRRPK